VRDGGHWAVLVIQVVDVERTLCAGGSPPRAAGI